MTVSFIHLHVHSEYSLHDGIVRIDELIEKAKKFRMPAVAITDMANLFAMVKFYQAAESAGIKAIIGSEVWLENENDNKNPHRLILLCQKNQGYHNLIQLISQAYVENQQQEKALIKKEWLRLHNSGLIAISAFAGGDIAEALIQNNVELAETLVEHWEGIFPHRFYLEITRLQEVEAEHFQALCDLSARKNCLLVASNDVRFLESEDFDAHEARVCIQEGRTLNDATRSSPYTESQYFKSTKEMQDLFDDIPEALQNSVEIAKRCNVELLLNQVYLPRFPVPSGIAIADYLQQMAQNGLELRLKDTQMPHQANVDAYYARLNLELEVINSMGFAGYFLIVADFIRWAKNNHIPVGPGRGSGAGSLVAYAMDITDIDPLQYDLLFERFLNPERVSMPDFDIDFCMEGRDKVIAYVEKTYGREAVSQIITFGTMAAKAVVRDVGRVLGHPYGFVDKLAKLIPLELGITLKKALAQEEALKERYEQEEEVKNLFDLAQRLEGITRNVGKHAGGLVIAPSKLTDFTPLYCEQDTGSLLTQFDKNDVETIGLIKFDFLGLRTLTLIDWALQAVNQELKIAQEPTLNINKISLRDEKTFDLLRSCFTTAVFQLESRGMKDLIRRLKPDSFEDIIALVALFRPGPLQSGMVDDFINRKHGRAKIEYPHPLIVPILKPTYGVILYQEQVMQIAQTLAGYSLGSADLLRRAMGKKKPEEMAKQREIFIQGAMQNQVKEQLAHSIFDLMEKFAGYGFNKSHSAAYALITYQTAWLKTHHRAAFMAAVLSSEMAHTDKIVLLIDECRRMGLEIVPPHINLSIYRFRALQTNVIIYGLGAIKGLGEAAIQNIIDSRTQHGVFKDLFDFCSRVDLRKISRRVLEALIRSGALDCFDPNRAASMLMVEEAVHAAEQLHKNNQMGQIDLFGHNLSVEDFVQSRPQYTVEPLDKTLLLKGEKDTLGLYLSGHPIQQYQQELKNFISSSISNLQANKKNKQLIAGFIINIRTIQTRKSDRMAIITVDDQTGRQEIAIFPDLFRASKELLIKDNLIIIEGEVTIDGYSGGLKIRALNIMNLQAARSNYAQFIKITLSTEQLNDLFINELAVILDKSNKRWEEGKHYCPIKVCYKSDIATVYLAFGKNWSLYPEDNSLQALQQLCGEHNVLMQY